MTWKNKSKEVEQEQRRIVVARALLRGATYQDIAEEIGMSTGTVCNDVQAILAQWRNQQADLVDDYFRLELQRLDKMMEGIWEKAITGNMRAIDAVLSIMRRRAKFLGLDEVPDYQFDVVKIDVYIEQQLAMMMAAQEEGTEQFWRSTPQTALLAAVKNMQQQAQQERAGRREQRQQVQSGQQTFALDEVDVIEAEVIDAKTDRRRSDPPERGLEGMAAGGEAGVSGEAEGTD